MEHKLTIEGTGAGTTGFCSCGQHAILCRLVTKNRRGHIRTEHTKHVDLAEKAARFWEENR